jgi:hypothetical protein
MFSALIDKFITFIGSIRWVSVKQFFTGKEFNLTEDDHNTLRDLLAANHYIILTRRNANLSTYAISFAHFFLTLRKGYYSHALMNLEGDVASDSDFRLVEATKSHGVAVAEFMHVFNCDSVVVLKPKNMTVDEWDAALEKAANQIGKKYDTLYNLADEEAMSCVELIRVALKGEPNYSTDFANFERMISKYNNLTPQMFYTCEDFEVVFEARR